MKKLRIKIDWQRLRRSSAFHNTLMFLVFVAVAIIFWFVLALNDSVTETFRVQVMMVNVPDSVTFINDPPATIHVTLRDKGTNIMRSGIVKNPKLELNFREYAHDGIFRLNHTDILTVLKSELGSGAQISSVSLDSLRLYYTTSPGRRVPVNVLANVTASSGYIISAPPTPLVKTVRIYSVGDEIDTVRRVCTQQLTRRDLQQTSTFDVKITPIKNVKIVPSSIQVRVDVEPLVHKDIFVNIDMLNVPNGESLLLFPNRVPVSLYVPMSHFNDVSYPLNVVVDYNDIRALRTERIKVRIATHAPELVNVVLKTDSVEYTVVKH